MSLDLMPGDTDPVCLGTTHSPSAPKDVQQSHLLTPPTLAQDLRQTSRTWQRMASG
jgi:hypothetical protein